MKCRYILAFCLFLIHSTAHCQNLNGRWQGYYLSSSVAADSSLRFNWADDIWDIDWSDGDAWTNFKADLQLAGEYKDLVGTYLLQEQNNPEGWGTLEFSGSFDFNTKTITWQLLSVLEGNLAIGKSKPRSLVYQQQGDYEYLRGHWKTEQGINGWLELRRSFSGIPLQNEENKKLRQPIKNKK